MNFAPSNAHNTTLFKNCNILKFADIINVESCADWIMIYIWFGPDTGKYGPEITPYLDTFQAVYVFRSYHYFSVENF